VNHLAHLLLSGPDADLRAGGFLGDFVRGRLRGDFPEGVELGIRLHRYLDACTDRHPLVRDAVALFPAEHRRWAPVALDVWFDHLLARDFERFAAAALPPFAARAYDDLDAHAPLMGPAPRHFLARMRSSDLLVRYTERETVTRVLERLAERSPRTRALAAVDGAFDALAAELDARFPALLADLVRIAAAWRVEHAGR
jgi:acyl carrier protein phosphodiesterase